jgi:hypothetical protein
MAGKSAAKAADVNTQTGSGLYGEAVSGSWSVAPAHPKITTYPKLKTGGSEVVHTVECKFLFVGTGPSPANNPVNGDSTLSLGGATKLLQKNQSSVVVDGMSDDDSYGNVLRAQASGKLKTS